MAVGQEGSLRLTGLPPRAGDTRRAMFLSIAVDNNLKETSSPMAAPDSSQFLLSSVPARHGAKFC